MIFAQLFPGQGLIVDTTALAAVALIGYLFGRRTRRAQAAPTDVTLLIELARAQCVAKDLEHLAQRLRTETQGHLAALAAFQGQVELMQRGSVTADWRQLRQHADALMGPTMSLASSLALACDEMRDQQSQLMTFADARVDRETGVLNRRALVEHLQARLTARGEGAKKVALVLCSVDVDPYASVVDGETSLSSVARLIEQFARENDVIARYGPQEFVLLLPRTTLDGGLIVGERLLKVVDASLERRVWAGVVEAEIEETPEELLARAESALRAAAKEETPTLFIHDGAATRRHAFELVDAHPDRLTGNAVSGSEDSGGGDMELEIAN
jgi:diguanylate cyclase (GGDEF)-like protein